MAPSLTLLAERHAQQSRLLEQQLIQAVWKVWAGLSPDDWWNDARVQVAAAESALLVESALQAGRRQARAYATRALLSAGVGSKNLPPVEEIYPRSGVTDVEVYRRIATAYRRSKRDVALGRARTRVSSLVMADMARAQRRVERDTFRMSDEVIGYRRIIHPELSRGGTCGLCIAAADRIYSVAELMPLHHGCNCLPAPVTALSDPGSPVNHEDLERLYEAAGSTSAEDLARVRVDADGTVTEPKTMTGGAGNGSLPPRRGMLGDMGDDEFPEIDGYKPPIRRSDIDEFTEDDAYVLLYGAGDGGHGYHSAEATDQVSGKSTFPRGWTEADVVTWVRGIMDHPLAYGSKRSEKSLPIYGVASGLEGVVVVSVYGSAVMVATAIPMDMVFWQYD